MAYHGIQVANSHDRHLRPQLQVGMCAISGREELAKCAKVAPNVELSDGPSNVMVHVMVHVMVSIMSQVRWISSRVLGHSSKQKLESTVLYVVYQ